MPGLAQTLHATIFNEVPPADPADTLVKDLADPTAAPASEEAAVTGETPAGQQLSMSDLQGKVEALFGQAPVMDKTKLDFNGMSELREKAFGAEDLASAGTWAANLTELKKQCFADNAVQPCQVLATESMYMASKYYTMWDEAMGMFSEMKGMEDMGTPEDALGHVPGVDVPETASLAASAQQFDKDIASVEALATQHAIKSGSRQALEDTDNLATPDTLAEGMKLAEANVGVLAAAALVGIFGTTAAAEKKADGSAFL